MKQPIVSAEKRPHTETHASLYGSIEKSYKSPESSSSFHPLPTGQSSICGVLGNFLNAMIGAGILAIPFVYAQVGLFGGLLLMLVFALICTYTLNLLIQAAQNFKVSEYEDLGYASFGSAGYIASSACLFLMDFGSMINYFIILGDAAFKVIQLWGYDEYYERQLLIVGVSLVIIFPPCLLRDISFYEKVSMVKMFAIALVVLVVIYQYFTHRVVMHYQTEGYHKQFMPPMSEMVWFDINGFGAAMGVVAYTFVCHDTAFIYYNTLLNPTTARWSTLCLVGILSAMLVSLCLSIPAFLTFGIHVDGNVMNNYAVDDPTIIFTRIIYVITMALTYPTAFFVCRHVICAWFYKLVSLSKISKYRNERSKNINVTNLEDDVQRYAQSVFASQYNVKTAPLWHHLVFTCALFFLSLWISLMIDNLGLAMGVVGSLSSVNLAFVLPCACYIQSVPYGFSSFITESKLRAKLTAWLAIYPPLLVAMFGIFVVVFSLLSIGMNID